MTTRPKQPQSATVPDNIVEFPTYRSVNISPATALPSQQALPPLTAYPSSTSLPPPQEDALLALIQSDIQRTAAHVQHEVFEDGIDNELSRTIQRLLRDYGAAVIYALSDLYLARLLDSELFSEILPWLGRTESRDRIDHEARFWSLAYSLRDADPSIRSSAALGLASLEDVRAAPLLRRQAESENIELLRRRLAKAADELSA